MDDEYTYNSGTHYTTVDNGQTVRFITYTLFFGLLITYILIFLCVIKKVLCFKTKRINGFVLPLPSNQPFVVVNNQMQQPVIDRIIDRPPAYQPRVPQFPVTFQDQEGHMQLHSVIPK